MSRGLPVSGLLWKQCLQQLEREVTGQAFNTWIRPLQAIEEPTALRLLAPNRFVLDHVKKYYFQQIEQALVRLRPHVSLALILQVGNRNQFSPELVTPSTATPFAQNSQLNPRLTFTSFVAGKSNQLARSASLQTAEQGCYNPLFIYGGVGLGKTHLLHAVGNQVITKKSHVKVLYLRSEHFVNDMIKALRSRTIVEFKRYYRSLDVLLIDDVQFFANKTQSQEELLHTFSELSEGHKQIIVTGNCTPQNMNGLQDSLKSRFSSGLTVAVDPPDLETRVAILITKARYMGFTLAETVAQFIAQRIQSNVRELEGALHRVIAISRLLNQPLNLDTAQAALEDLLMPPLPSVTMREIQKAVADYYKIPLAELSSAKRHRKWARPRQIAMCLCKDLTQHSLPEIGRAFGGRDHATVIYSYKAVGELRTKDKQTNQDYENLLRRLSTP